MSNYTDQQVRARVRKDFSPDEFAEVMDLLSEYDNSYSSNPEFMRLAILRLANGRKETLRPMLNTAKIDSRDILFTVQDEYGTEWIDQYVGQ